jgi:hypothetical protein
LVRERFSARGQPTKGVREPKHAQRLRPNALLELREEGAQR